MAPPPPQKEGRTQSMKGNVTSTAAARRRTASPAPFLCFVRHGGGFLNRRDLLGTVAAMERAAERAAAFAPRAGSSGRRRLDNPRPAENGLISPIRPGDSPMRAAMFVLVAGLAFPFASTWADDPPK